MRELKQRIHDDSNGLDYVLAGDYYIPDIEIPEANLAIGMWGRLHRDYLKEYHAIVYNNLLLSGKLWNYLLELNAQAQARYDLIVRQMQEFEHVDALKGDFLSWLGTMENIRASAREIVLNEMIYTAE